MCISVYKFQEPELGEKEKISRVLQHIIYLHIKMHIRSTLMDTFTCSQSKNKTWQGINTLQLRHGGDFGGGRLKGWGLEL